MTIRLFGHQCSIEIGLPAIDEERPYRVTAYRKALKRIQQAEFSVTGLVIPSKIPRQDFDPLYFIEHLRLSSDLSVSTLPVVICATDVVPVSAEWEEAYLERFGVLWSDAGMVEISQIDLPERLKHDALEVYRGMIANRPRFVTENHDLSNLWGPYAFLKGLSDADKRQPNAIEGIVETISEDTFFAKRILQDTEFSPEVEITREISREIKRARGFCRARGDQIRVLIVDDQLRDGWKVAYEALLQRIGDGFQFVFCSSKSDAERHPFSDFALIVLDVRIDPQNDPTEEDLAQGGINSLSGVRLAKSIRKTSATVPILAATASNKVWTLESLTKHGINAYWIKQSPGGNGGDARCGANLLDFIRKFNDLLSFSFGARGRVESTIKLSRKISKAAGSAEKFVQGLEEKCRLLVAHEFHGVDTTRNISDTSMHHDVSFLLHYSIINDLYTWLLREQAGHGKVVLPNGKWFNLFSPCPKTRHRVSLHRDAHNLLPGWVHDSWQSFPERLFFEASLRYLNMVDEASLLDRMRRIRNNLPIIHGKIDRRDRSYVHASESDIVELSNLMLNFTRRVFEG